LADGRAPTYHDLTDGAAAILAGVWSDAELLAFAVGLMFQPLVTPFDVEADSKRRRKALELTLNVIRGPRGNLADQIDADQVKTSLDWTKGQLSGGRSFPWGTVLIASGLALLAATSVGLAVAAPAGLAGAAVVTSTLAAFGLGGMVGGLLTLSAMIGTAGVLSGLGVAATLRGTASARNVVSATARTGAELAQLPPETLTVTLAGMVAVVHVHPKLGFDSTETFVRAAIAVGRDLAVAEHQQHVAPLQRAPKPGRGKSRSSTGGAQGSRHPDEPALG
jgi:hypothetical protein